MEMWFIATVRLMEFVLTFGMYSIERVCLGYIPQMAFETRDGMMAFDDLFDPNREHTKQTPRFVELSAAFLRLSH